MIFYCCLGFDSHYFLLTREDSINIPPLPSDFLLTRKDSIHTPPLHPVIFWLWGRREGAVWVSNYIADIVTVF